MLTLPPRILGSIARGGKNEAAKANPKAAALPNTHLVVYSDGSKSEVRAGYQGYGYVIYRGKDKIAQGKGRLGDAEVLDGKAGTLSLRHAMKLHQGKPLRSALTTPRSSLDCEEDRQT